MLAGNLRLGLYLDHQAMPITRGSQKIATSVLPFSLGFRVILFSFSVIKKTWHPTRLVAANWFFN
jgi:hypothetical protein